MQGLPPGSYRIEALFGGRDAPVVAGRLTLAAGQDVVLTCMPNFLKCQ